MKSEFRKENQFRLHGESCIDKCAEMIMNRSQICCLCLGEWKKSVSWREWKACLSARLETWRETCGLGTFSETVWKVQIEGEMQRKKINLGRPQNMSAVGDQCEKWSWVKAKVKSWVGRMASEGKWKFKGVCSFKTKEGEVLSFCCSLSAWLYKGLFFMICGEKLQIQEGSKKP